ncbi:hypothetical protein [Thermocatellispora tengchongensis]|uniref:hypothetical protein n=1 Tax=Thermocatellispora tengchongensis TaxID=1073253 RepID=UPI0036363A04
MRSEIMSLANCLVAVLPTLSLTALLGTGLGNLFTGAALPYRIFLPAVAVSLALTVHGAVPATDAVTGRASSITVREALPTCGS